MLAQAVLHGGCDAARSEKSHGGGGSVGSC